MPGSSSSIAAVASTGLGATADIMTLNGCTFNCSPNPVKFIVTVFKTGQKETGTCFYLSVNGTCFYLSISRSYFYFYLISLLSSFVRSFNIDGHPL